MPEEMFQQGKRFDIGALWPRFDKFNKEYFTGHIEINGVRVNIVVFENTLRRQDNHPVMVIREDKRKERLRESKQYKWGE